MLTRSFVLPSLLRGMHAGPGHGGGERAAGLRGGREVLRVRALHPRGEQQQQDAGIQEGAGGGRSSASVGDRSVCVVLVCVGQDFGIESVRLMTNNPFKVRSLQALDVVVSNVVPHQVGEAGPRMMLLAGWDGSEGVEGGTEG